MPCQFLEGKLTEDWRCLKENHMTGGKIPQHGGAQNQKTNGLHDL